MDDVGTAKLERPDAVTIAVALLWTDFVLGIVNNFVAGQEAVRDWTYMPMVPPPGVIVAVAALWGVYALVIYGTGRGFTWARWAVLAIVAIGFVKGGIAVSELGSAVDWLFARHDAEQGVRPECWDCGPFPPGLFGMTPEEWKLASLMISLAQTAILVAASVSLFMPSANRWFRTSHRRSD